MQSNAFSIKKPFRAIILPILLMLLWQLPAAAQPSAVHVAVDAAYPPYMYGGNPAKGLYPEIIRAAFSLSDIPVKITGYPWKRALVLGRQGQVAIGGIYENTERLKRFDFSNPLFTETLLVCVRKGHAFPFTGIVDLKGKRVGVNRGWSYGEVFDSARRAGLFTAEEAGSNAANLKKLIFGRVDCIIADALSLSHLLHRKGWRDKVETLAHPAAVNSVYLVFAKQAKQSRLLEQFNQGLLKMKADGDYRRIVDKYIH